MAGGLANFEDSGQMPVRTDVASSPLLRADNLVQPFITAADNAATWPDNPNTSAMQTAMGQVVSAAVSGQLNPSAAAAQAITNIDAALKKGGGGC